VEAIIERDGDRSSKFYIITASSRRFAREMYFSSRVFRDDSTASGDAHSDSDNKLYIPNIVYVNVTMYIYIYNPSLKPHYKKHTRKRASNGI